MTASHCNNCNAAFWFRLVNGRTDQGSGARPSSARAGLTPFRYLGQVVPRWPPTRAPFVSGLLSRMATTRCCSESGGKGIRQRSINSFETRLWPTSLIDPTIPSTLLHVTALGRHLVVSSCHSPACSRAANIQPEVVEKATVERRCHKDAGGRSALAASMELRFKSHPVLAWPPRDLA
jgi:hypothetical protein